MRTRLERIARLRALTASGERELLRVVLEQSATAIVAFDRGARVTHASAGARGLLGEAGAPGAAPGRWVEVLEPHTAEGLPLGVSDLPQVRVLSGKAPPRFDLRVKTGSGGRLLRAHVQTLSAAASAAVVVRFELLDAALCATG